MRVSKIRKFFIKDLGMKEGGMGFYKELETVRRIKL